MWAPGGQDGSPIADIFANRPLSAPADPSSMVCDPGLSGTNCSIALLPHQRKNRDDFFSIGVC